MARTWREVRADAVEAGIDQGRVAEIMEEMRAAERAFKLAEVRRAKHVTQKVVADGMGVAQPRVSAIERGRLDSTELGTLRSYVETLGGTLRVIADFGDEFVVVQG
ncbi:helix-turn-helix domain-containing protein [Myceligenerans crystallogenes]|uniref:Helix-turn-helix domain-containing protein n=2 Tax=Myceligenerans crystallogenes TaxID=316335 RepID=A0ABN2NMP5_9MICO